MRVLHVASEVAPFAQTGGLADVLGGLPAALAEHGVEVAVLAPLYRGLEARLAAAGATLGPGSPITVAIGPYAIPAAIRAARIGQVTYGFVDCPPLYDRAGSLYGPNPWSDFGDNHLRFGLLGKVAVEHGATLLGGPPHVLHCHDWQGSPAAIYARLASAPVAIVTTIHNLGFRGIFHKDTMNDLGFPWSLFTLHALEFHDQLSFLKGGLALADVVTAVSPSYAWEILTPQFGEGLDAFLRNDVKRVIGIVNGIDVASWDPETDRELAAPFSASSPGGKADCRAALAAELGFKLSTGQPLLAAISRMSGQKGLDLIADIVPELYRLDARLVVLGSGDPEIESRYRYLGRLFREHLAVRIGFDSKLSRRIYAGSDLFVMPSRFEPCGLGQLYAMRYGSVPVVHAVGGLRDTVRDPGDEALARGQGEGFAFHAPTASALHTALHRAVTMFRNQPSGFATLREAAMSRDSSWTASARDYVRVYEALRP